MGCCGKGSDDGRNDNMDMGDGKDRKNRGGKWGAPKPFDPNFNGPIKSRSCTDIICCILFVLYIAIFVAMMKKDLPKLVFFDLTECVGALTQLCVKKCPDQNALGFEVNQEDLEKIDLIRNKQCAPYYLKSSDVLNRCIPTIVGNTLTAGLQTASGQNVSASDVQEGSLAVQALLNLQNIGQKYQELSSNTASNSSVFLTVSFGLDTVANSKDTWYWLTIILGIILGILLLILLALYKRISIAIQIIKEGSRAVSAVPFTLIFPFSFLVTAGEPQFQVVSNDTDNGKLCTAKFVSNANLSFVWLVLVVEFHHGAWNVRARWFVCLLLLGLGQENCPGEQSEITKYLIKCLKCCFWCLEKFLKFLNKNAVVVLDKVTDFILFLGQLTITAGIAVGSFYWFERQENLNYYLAPVIIITVGSYVVAHAFFSVYNMAIDTIFLCFSGVLMEKKDDLNALNF
ncbi:Choline transporter-like protein 4 [Acropora cervicornis]|uniref:Choline transporter-like protein n=1 Tax=Acropora cervicornis TaxID=6130 RepID=A0AAD9QRT7_ACRCE|nr:Choline transporter-like protein 4 [Acropora cervicornis]